MNNQVYTLFCKGTEIVTGTFRECAARISWELGGYDDPQLEARNVTLYQAQQNGFYLQPVRG